jgi:hypothetical protein
MGREGENLPLARASRPSVADALQGVGCRAWRITRAVDCRSGTKGQPPVFPGAGWPPGEAAAPTGYAAPWRFDQVCRVAHLQDRHPIGPRRRYGGLVGAESERSGACRVATGFTLILTLAFCSNPVE